MLPERELQVRIWRKAEDAQTQALYTVEVDGAPVCVNVPFGMARDELILLLVDGNPLGLLVEE